MFGLSRPAGAAEVHVAVASNFTAVMDQLAPRFSAATGHTVLLSFGASGTLYAQIRNGAPFAVLLSADSERPRRLEEAGFTVMGSRFTYAIGRLMLWSKTPGVVDRKGEVLSGGDFKYLAIANPETAPYGAAAVQTLQRLGVWEKLRDRIVEGENISQTFQFVASGNADLGFVALSQLNEQQASSAWLVPKTLYAPIEQQAVLLEEGADNPAAGEFLAFLKGAEGRAVIRAAGYDLTEKTSVNE